MFSIIVAGFFIFSVLPAIAFEVADCSCGFQDDRTASFYTDSIVLYFNETSPIDPAVFLARDFAHKKQQGWNSIFKVGAKAANARISNTTDKGAPVQALEMVLDPADKDHLVVGASLQSTRRDIQYGLFEAAMKPASQWSGGTVLTFGLNFNSSNGAEIDFMNADDPSDAQVANLINGEWPASDLVTNFTTMESAGVHPWTGFTDVSFSWNESVVAFDIANNMTRLVTKQDRSLPSAGQALVIKTWSTGDNTFGEGPPMQNATHGDVLYVRTFFNSTEMTRSQHAAYNERCIAAPRCKTNDLSLRGYTAYSPASELKWKAPPKNKGIRTLAGIVAACCSSFGVFALANVFLRRTPWKKLWLKKVQVVELPEEPNSPRTDSCKSSSGKSISEKSEGKGTATGTQTPAPAYGTQTPRSGSHTPAPSYHSAAPSIYHAHDLTSTTSLPCVLYSNTLGVGKLDKALDRISEMSHLDKSDVERLKSLQTLEHSLEHPDQITPITSSSNPSTSFVDEGALPKYPTIVVTQDGKQPATDIKLVEESTASADATVVPAPVLKSPTVRVDYLSGLTSVACIGVTLHHFGQTFWPFIIEGYGPTSHYPAAEKWLHIFVGGIILSNLWIGPFFLTATRFLSTNYLKHGNLEDIAKKELRRAPRLFVPIIIISLLQYFLISMGLTASLEWLPSVTYSSWPYVVAQSNFAVWMNNIVQLAYMIPNAVPEISAHYCIGVLWTIPVQLQFTYVVLAGTVVIRDVRTPWKRFGVYALVIVAGWYARSWSACHWMGLVLSDLEATYKWRNHLSKRPILHYAVLNVALISALGATLFSVFNSKWSFNIAENSIHPDFRTGNPLIAEGALYPSYQEPTLAILLFSIGLQITVELSTWVQAFLSRRFFLFLNPMIFTVYLTHGFVMWTWGAWVSLACNGAGMPYWANLLVTLVTTYVVIFALAWVLTPLLEFPTQALMRNLDRWTKEEPKPKRPTTAPFSKDIVLNRGGDGSVGSGGA